MTIAIRVPNWLGDAVMARPAVEAVARATGTAPVIIAAASVAAAFPDFPVRILESRFDADAYRAAGAEIILLLTHSFSSALSARRAGIRERIGYARHLRSWLLTRPVVPLRPVPHQIDEYLHLVREAGYRTGERDPRLPPRANRPIAGAYVVLAPGARYGGAKRWPGFAALGAALAARGRAVVVLGGAGEGFDGPGIVNLAGRTTLEEALDHVAHADLVVSNDSGLAHAARALGRRTLVLFGPTDPVRTAPRGAEILSANASCAPCNLRTCPIDHRCMTGIAVEVVLERIG